MYNQQNPYGQSPQYMRYFQEGTPQGEVDAMRSPYDTQTSQQTAQGAMQNPPNSPMSQQQNPFQSAMMPMFLAHMIGGQFNRNRTGAKGADLSPLLMAMLMSQGGFLGQ